VDTNQPLNWAFQDADTSISPSAASRTPTLACLSRDQRTHPRMGRQSGGLNATVYVIVVGWATLPALFLALTMPNGNQPS
jgi:hypothetical protein